MRGLIGSPAREGGEVHDIPLPEVAETYGLTEGEAALLADQRDLIWIRHGDTKTVHRQHAPDDVDDLDAWAERCTTRLRSYRITYTGRREVVA